MNIITVTFYKLIIGIISLLYIYEAHLMNVNIITGLIITLCSLGLALFFRSYNLFYTSLIILIIVSYRYYNKKRDRMGHNELFSIFVLNLINISFSVYTLYQMIYHFPVKIPVQSSVSFTYIAIVEAAPVIHIIIIYSIIGILALSINRYLSIGNEANLGLSIFKTTSMAVSIAMLIIVVNAAMYFIIHNFPSSQFSGIFDGNFLKDPVRYYHRSAKAFSDCLWFSATTFFTVGYGDMHPVGNIMYLLSMMEMVSAYILGLIIIPILLFRLSSE